MTFLVVLDFALGLLLDNLIFDIVDALAEYFFQLVFLIYFFGAHRLYLSQVLLFLLEYSLFLRYLFFDVAEFGLLQGKTGTVCAGPHHVEAGVGDATQVRVHACERPGIARAIEFHGCCFWALE